MVEPESLLCECPKSTEIMLIRIFCIINVVNSLEGDNGHFGVDVSGLYHEKWKPEQTLKY